MARAVTKFSPTGSESHAFVLADRSIAPYGFARVGTFPQAPIGGLSAAGWNEKEVSAQVPGGLHATTDLGGELALVLDPVGLPRAFAMRLVGRETDGDDRAERQEAEERLPGYLSSYFVARPILFAC